MEGKIYYLYGDTADKFTYRWRKSIGIFREKLPQPRIAANGPCMIDCVAHAARGSRFIYLKSFKYLIIIVRRSGIVTIGILT